VLKYKEHKGDFEPWARWQIKIHILKELRNSRLVNLPDNIKEIIIKPINAIIGPLNEQFERGISVHDLRHYLDEAIERLRKICLEQENDHLYLLKKYVYQRNMSLFERLRNCHDNDTALEIISEHKSMYSQLIDIFPFDSKKLRENLDFINYDFKTLIDKITDKELIAEVLNHLSELDERKYEIIHDRYLVDAKDVVTHKTLAERFGVSVRRIGQLEKEAILILRKKLAQINIS
jgi:RNA polymerase sigma factor (sigma-70 family)